MLDTQRALISDNKLASNRSVRIPELLAESDN